MIAFLTTDNIRKMEVGSEEWAGSFGIKRVNGGILYLFYDEKTDTISSCSYQSI